MRKIHPYSPTKHPLRKDQICCQTRSLPEALPGPSPNVFVRNIKATAVPQPHHTSRCQFQNRPRIRKAFTWTVWTEELPSPTLQVPTQPTGIG